MLMAESSQLNFDKEVRKMISQESVSKRHRHRQVEERCAPLARERHDSRRGLWRRQGPDGGGRRSQADHQDPALGIRAQLHFRPAVDSDNAKVMIVDWQYEPIKGHAAARRSEAHRHGQGDARQRAGPADGQCRGVKTQGGILDQVLREVEIECLPGDIPTTSTSTSAIWSSDRCCASPICRTTAS